MDIEVDRFGQLGEWRSPYAEESGAASGSGVYFVQAEAGGLIKIGYSSVSAESRLRDFQIGCPVRLIVISVIAGIRADETKLHRMFANIRVHGEWFRPTDRLINFIKSSGGVINDPKPYAHVRETTGYLSQDSDDLAEWLAVQQRYGME